MAEEEFAIYNQYIHNLHKRGSEGSQHLVD